MTGVRMIVSPSHPDRGVSFGVARRRAVDLARLASSLAGLWLVGAFPASAADWWTTTDSASRMKVGVDVEHLVCRGGVCSVPQRVAGAATGDVQTPAAHVADYDCTGLRVRGDPAVSAPAATAWRPVSPNSAAEAVLTFVCTFGERQAGLGDDDTLNADGRTFVRVSASPTSAAKSAKVQEPTKKAQSAPRAPTVRGVSEGPMAVQIAAVASQALARSQIKGVGDRYPQLLRGLSTRVEPAKAGGHQVFRALIVNLANAQSARQLCTALKSRSVACFVKPDS